MSGFDSDMYRRLVETSMEGISLVDAQHPDHPVVYANPVFEALTGYTAAELNGRNLGLLQGSDREQDGRHRLRAALQAGEPCRVLLRNYRKDGSVFWNEMSVLPLRDAQGQLTHFAGHHRDAAERLRIDPKLSRDRDSTTSATGATGKHAAMSAAAALREDRLTGLATACCLEEQLKRDWPIAQRENRSIAVFAVDIDSLNLYNTTFGRGAGDSMIRRVAHVVAGCLRRSSDITARIDGGLLMAFAPGLPHDQAFRVGQTISERVRDLRIHHPRSAILRYVSVSVGVCAAVPDSGEDPANFMRKAQQQLQIAKSAGRNQAA